RWAAMSANSESKPVPFTTMSWVVKAIWTWPPSPSAQRNWHQGKTWVDLGRMISRPTARSSTTILHVFLSSTDAWNISYLLSKLWNEWTPRAWLLHLMHGELAARCPASMDSLMQSCSDLRGQLGNGSSSIRLGDRTTQLFFVACEHLHTLPAARGGD